MGVGVVGSGAVISPSQLDTEPVLYVASVTETSYPYRVNVAGYIVGSDTVSNVSANMFYASAAGGKLGSAWQTSITTSGSLITVLIDMSQLQLGQSYYIVTTFTANTNKVSSIVSKIQVVA